MMYSGKGLRRRSDTDKWEVTLAHRDPLSGEVVRSYYTVTARTEKQARKRKDELVRDLEHRGLSAGSRMTISELADLYLGMAANMPDGWSLSFLGMFAFVLMPRWLKASWRNGSLQPAKLYHLAKAKLVENAGNGVVE